MVFGYVFLGRRNGLSDKDTLLLDTLHCHSRLRYIGKASREPSLGLVLLWFIGLSVSLLPEVFEDLVDAIDVTHRGLPADPINYYGPFECTDITLRLGKDLVGSGWGVPCDETR